MDKRVGLWSVLVVLVLFACIGTTLPTTLLTFMILGTVPGTELTMPLWVVMFVYPVVGIGALYWLLSQPLFIGERPGTVLKTPVVAKVKKPKTARQKRAVKRPVRTAV